MKWILPSVFYWLVWRLVMNVFILCKHFLLWMHKSSLRNYNNNNHKKRNRLTLNALHFFLSAPTGYRCFRLIHLLTNGCCQDLHLHPQRQHNLCKKRAISLGKWMIRNIWPVFGVFLKEGIFGKCEFFISDGKHSSAVFCKGRVHHYSALLRGWMHTLELHPSASFSQKPFLKAFASLPPPPPPQLCFCYGEAAINRSAVLKDKTNMLKGCDPLSDGCLFSLRPIRKSLAVFSPSLNA